MVFERFLSAFAPAEEAPSMPPPPSANLLDAWIDMAGGRSFGRGIYRLHTKDSARHADEWVSVAFPEFAGRLSCFGFDWLGRQFATDAGRGSQIDPEVMLLEPGTGEALEIPVPFSRFHDEELVDYTEEALAKTFFDQWLAAGGVAPEFSECVGYRRPLFLGGQDEVSNLELCDIEVYWTLLGELRRQVRGLPPGTPISDLKIQR